MRAGYGYGWAERSAIEDDGLRSKQLLPLPLETGNHPTDLFLVHADRDIAGPATLRLSELLREEVSRPRLGKEARTRRTKGS